MYKFLISLIIFSFSSYGSQNFPTANLRDKAIADYVDEKIYESHMKFFLALHDYSKRHIQLKYLPDSEKFPEFTQLKQQIEQMKFSVDLDVSLEELQYHIRNNQKRSDDLTFITILACVFAMWNQVDIMCCDAPTTASTIKMLILTLTTCVLGLASAIIRVRLVLQEKKQVKELLTQLNSEGQPILQNRVYAFLSAIEEYTQLNIVGIPADNVLAELVLRHVPDIDLYLFSNLLSKIKNKLDACSLFKKELLAQF